MSAARRSSGCIVKVDFVDDDVVPAVFGWRRGVVVVTYWI